MKLNFVLAESALELMPKELLKSPAVVNDARRRGLDASRILLDRSFHHSAMSRLRDSEKRGRPDLVHEAVLNVTGTPLFLEGSVRLFVHTCAEMVFEVAERTRIPKSYFRFRGLVEKLLAERSADELVKVYPGTLQELVRRISPDAVFGLSVQGRQTRLEELTREVCEKKNPCVLVGGFPRGHFSQGTLELVDELARIHPRPLEAHVVAARVVYEVEKALAGSTIKSPES
ncbi:MAG: ribosome biogenesis protein, partial [Candidatus Gagatemarchaeaceae archaeon]